MPRIFIDFRPAEVVNKKETYVAFYVLNPYTRKMTRKRIRCNHVRGKADRLKYARLLCQAVNDRLYEGWNPFLDDLPGGPVTVREAVSRFLAAKGKSARKRTMDSYRSSSDMFLEWLTLHKMDKAYCVTIDRKNLLDYLSWSASRKCLSNKSYNNYCIFLGTLFGFFKETGLILDNPAERIPRRKVDSKLRVTIPKPDRKAIRDFVDEHIPRFYYVMQMCFRLFMRPNEIVQLRVGDIDFDNGLIRVPSYVAKNHGERVLAVPGELMEYFRTLSQYPPTYYIFAGGTYAPAPKRIAPTRIADTWREMREKLKLPASYQFYSLKDTGITEMLEAGVPAKYVKELAGHHSLEMTERYTHRSEAKKILEWNRLEF
jgi:integrase